MTVQELEQLADLPTPADEARQRHRDVAHGGPRRAQGWELRTQAGNVQLEQPFRAGNVLERMEPQVADQHAVRQRIDGQ